MECVARRLVGGTGREMKVWPGLARRSCQQRIGRNRPLLAVALDEPGRPRHESPMSVLHDRSAWGGVDRASSAGWGRRRLGSMVANGSRREERARHDVALAQVRVPPIRDDDREAAVPSAQGSPPDASHGRRRRWLRHRADRWRRRRRWGPLAGERWGRGGTGLGPRRGRSWEMPKPTAMAITPSGDGGRERGDPARVGASSGSRSASGIGSVAKIDVATRSCSSSRRRRPPRAGSRRRSRRGVARPR